MCGWNTLSLLFEQPTRPFLQGEAYAAALSFDQSIHQKQTLHAAFDQGQLQL